MTTKQEEMSYDWFGLMDGDENADAKSKNH